ncbi:DEAD/DEAH box helicase [Pseudodesulfovibrio portus]|uniref:ATP-dependent RNA helicase RhlE n=1 Tax=Pseudodesulfovibrio portus TaxID=231439 RepID=A0ABN6RYB2_9BACT|nr:DEAD/DEAH box helicase [Pseudodesulfovibrio portus]BDQ35027.1 ATP-dependent RNA helicase RhlE [Pseudodesulfovibrio portus]
MTFQTFSFDSRIEAGIKSCGYAVPTPIQEQAIPLVLEGHDVMGLAQTGTGKTAAFALPLLQKIISCTSRQRTPRVLILAPTRELALQITEDFNSLGRRTGIRSCAVIGGVAMGQQIRACKTSQVIVACPGRLVALTSRMGVVNLGTIDTLVLDEADRMLDMGFMPDIKRVIAQLPAKRQNLLFSATMPKDIRLLANKILNNPKTVQVANTSPVASVNHVFYKTHTSQKNALLENLLSRAEHKSMLIFTRTKHKARDLSRKLSQRGWDTTFLQGNMSQNQRQRALDGFRKGRFSIMVATDIAARGLDCDRITHVVNYDMPDTVETYTHRIGRTGRAGRSGNAITLVTQADIGQVRAIERAMKITVKPEVPSGFEPQANAPEPRSESRPYPTGKGNARNGRRNKRRPARAAA